MDDYKIIIEQEHQTVMAHYEVEAKPAEGYQSEAKLENALIKQLQGQGYEYVNVKNEEGLLRNLRQQLELLNDVKLSDSEWNRLLPKISNDQMTIQDKTEMLQGKGYILNITLDNGQTKNIKLVDKTNIYNNRLQVTNQYEVENGAYKNRYDVTILVNGLPMVQIELKKRGKPIKEAFNQIDRYLRDSFWAGRAMFDFVQIFVISNGTETKYYSNTTRYAKEQESTGASRKNKTDGNTFEFTSYWTDQENTLLTDLRDFTTTFFAKHTILNILTNYCVFNVDKQLLVMRPYQIAATEKILQAVTTPNYSTCVNYSYTYVRAGKPFPRPYPGEALEALEAADGALENLQTASKLAAEADGILKEMLAKAGLSEQDTMCLLSLRGETIRIQAIANSFAYLLDLRAKLKSGMVLKSMATSTLKATDELIHYIADFEQCKPGWVVPASLQALSTLLSFFKQLTQELKKHAARKQANQLNWRLLP